MPFFDLRAGYEQDRPGIGTAVQRVLESGVWVGGAEVEAFEAAWAQASGSAHAVGVGNGTDAITLALWALGIGAGDEVLVPALSAYPTTVGVLRSGALPVFVDVRAEDGLLDAAKLESRLTPRCKAVLPVHLYGNPCDMGAIAAFAARHGLKVVEDCAQAHLLRFEGRPVGSGSDAASWSFYPTKNLGAVGDAGAVTTGSQELADRLKRLRNYGQADRYRHVEDGVNSRLDPLQAAILSARLPGLPARTARRAAIAARYEAALEGNATLRCIRPQAAWTRNHHLFPVFVGEPSRREPLRQALLDLGVETLVHYPLAMPEQPATPQACRQGDFSVARQLAATEISLPIYPELSDAQVSAVIGALSQATA